LVADIEINNILNIEKALKPIISEGKKLLIISPCSGNVINTLAANVMKNGLKVCVIQPPNFGWKQKELMADIAFSLKASYFSEATGDDLSHVEFGDLGHAKKIIIGRDSSIIIKDEEGVDAEKTDTRVVELWEQHKVTKNPADQLFILERIAALKGGIGVIHVGGYTDLEQKEKFDRVDDAVCAVRSALQEGILPGGGIALYDEAERLEYHPSKSPEEDAALKIFRNALRAPFEQIMINSGKPIDLLKTYVNGSGKKIGFGYDIKREKYGDLLEMGVIDPAKVTKSALANAVSVAITILSTNAIITLARTYNAE
jgi:chaperonin GroEL